MVIAMKTGREEGKKNIMTMMIGNIGEEEKKTVKSIGKREIGTGTGIKTETRLEKKIRKNETKIAIGKDAIVTRKMARVNRRDVLKTKMKMRLMAVGEDDGLMKRMMTKRRGTGDVNMMIVMVRGMEKMTMGLRGGGVGIMTRMMTKKNGRGDTNKMMIMTMKKGREGRKDAKREMKRGTKKRRRDATKMEMRKIENIGTGIKNASTVNGETTRMAKILLVDIAEMKMGRGNESEKIEEIEIKTKNTEIGKGVGKRSKI